MFASTHVKLVVRPILESRSVLPNQFSDFPSVRSAGVNLLTTGLVNVINTAQTVNHALV